MADDQLHGSEDAEPDGGERPTSVAPPDLSLGAAGFDGLLRQLDGLARQSGERIGNYRLVELIGQGGMGEVWRAEQRKPMQRFVALKLLKPGIDTRALLARFEAERQALAVMNHPFIARVLDAGADDRGRPFFAMEFVPGEPITVYCDRHRLGVRERLGLFADVCDAVQHAHSKGIIHRDIKPSNVLVMLQDGKPIPKVIDFGIAKAVRGPLTDMTLVTGFGQLLGTPEYMSPEQAEGGPLDVDTRSDVYSLGVILYELLVGRLPFEPSTLRHAAQAEICRIIREVDPPKPSTALATMVESDSTKVVEHRRTRLRDLSGELSRELEWIPLAALRKDRSERYATAKDFGDDVRNYLAGRPLVAAPPSTMYRVRKYVKRHRGGVTAAAVIVAVVLAGMAATGWQAVRATRAEQLADARATEENRQRQEAQRQAALAQRQLRREQAASDFAFDILSGVDPAVSQQMDSSLLLLILERAEARLFDRIDDPVDRAGYLSLIGDLYQRYGKPERGEVMSQEAVKLATDAFVAARESGGLADNDFDALRVLVQACSFRARRLSARGDVAGAAQVLEPALTLADAHLPADDIDRVWLLNDRAMLAADAGDNESATRHFEQLLGAMGIDRAGFTDLQRATAHDSLAVLYKQGGDAARSAAHAQQAESLYRSGDATKTPQFANHQYNRAIAALAVPNLADAMARLDEVAAIRNEIYKDPNHPDRADEWAMRAMVLLRHGNAEGAVAAQRRSYEIRTRKLPDQKLALADAGERLGLLLARADQSAEADAMLVEAIRLFDEAGESERRELVNQHLDRLRARLATRPATMPAP